MYVQSSLSLVPRPLFCVKISNHHRYTDFGRDGTEVPTEKTVSWKVGSMLLHLREYCKRYCTSICAPTVIFLSRLPADRIGHWKRTSIVCCSVAPPPLSIFLFSQRVSGPERRQHHQRTSGYKESKDRWVRLVHVFFLFASSSVLGPIGTTYKK